MVQRHPGYQRGEPNGTRVTRSGVWASCHWLIGRITIGGVRASRFAKYFWSVIAVDSTRFRVLPNPKQRYLLNDATNPKYGPDGSLTLYFAAERPEEAPDGNWLPTPRGHKYRLTFRYYGPLDGVANGTYWPPAMIKLLPR